MRALAGELAMAGKREKADRLLAMGVTVIHATQSWQIAEIRSELLSWTLEPALQDDLSGVLTQLRALQHGLQG
jgi:hypothetical protein